MSNQLFKRQNKKRNERIHAYKDKQKAVQQDKEQDSIVNIESADGSVVEKSKKIVRRKKGKMHQRTSPRYLGTKPKPTHSHDAKNNHHDTDDDKSHERTSSYSDSDNDNDDVDKEEELICDEG